MIIRDFNVEAMPVLQRYVSFSDSYSVKNLIKEPTCYKNPNKPFCIDLMLTKNLLQAFLCNRNRLV